MFFHHFFTFPDAWIDSVLNIYTDNYFEIFQNGTNLCVSIFAFLTGFFYYYNNNKTVKYSIKKITDFWINYICVFLILLLVDFLFNRFDYSVFQLILETFALSRKTMVFCWYVVFYIGTMVLMPFYSKLSSKNDFFPFALVVVIPIFLVYYLGASNNAILLNISDIIGFFYYLPCVAIGYLFAKHDVFTSLNSCFRIKNRIMLIIIYSLFIIIPFFTRAGNRSFDFIFAPLFIFGMVSIVRLIRYKNVLFPILLIGRYSMLMWFIHCVFFNVCKEYTQPFLYFLKNPFLVLIWGLLVCLIIAFLISIPINGLTKLKNRIFRL